MKLKEYLILLNKLVKNHPETLEMHCFTSSDDEGNSYLPIHYEPSITYMNSDCEIVHVKCDCLNVSDCNCIVEDNDCLKVVIVN